jgi:hypothetical protein
MSSDGDQYRDQPGPATRHVAARHDSGHGEAHLGIDEVSVKVTAEQQASVATADPDRSHATSQAHHRSDSGVFCIRDGYKTRPNR